MASCVPRYGYPQHPQYQDRAFEQHHPTRRMAETDRCGIRHAPLDGSISTMETNPFLRIALLEKELEYCRIEKAEAEIALQCLAKLKVDSASANGSGNENGRNAYLQQQLTQSEKDKNDLAAKLENSLEIIAAMIRLRAESPSTATNVHPSSTTSTTVVVETGELIDLHDANGDSDNTLVSNGKDSTPEMDDDTSSDGMDDVEPATQSKAIWEEEFPEQPYKHRFTDHAINGNQHRGALPIATKEVSVLGFLLVTSTD